jgi:type IV pilus assembly protein PilM
LSKQSPAKESAKWPWRARVRRWLHAMPHPRLVCAVHTDRVGVARWGRHRLEAFAERRLAPGALQPSSVQPNLLQPEALRKALAEALQEVGGSVGEAALLVPDPVARVFVLEFETFPRRREDALPLLRWRLRKSLPFPADEAVVSWFLQPRGMRVEAVTAVARASIVGEYERVLTAVGLVPAVVLSAGLALLPLLEDGPPSAMVSCSSESLVTAVVAEDRLVLYRCAELARRSSQDLLQNLLEEIAPVMAYFQDASGRSIEDIWLSGCVADNGELSRRLQAELGRSVRHIELDLRKREVLPEGAAELFQRNWAPLVGWEMNRGA